MRFMLTPSSPFRAWTLPLATALLSLAFAAPAVPTPAASSSGPAKAATNAAPVAPEPPKSAFIIPSSSQEGKDPFFPQSTRLHKLPVVSSTSTNRVVAVVELDLKGISGVGNRRLAIINNRTFGANEDGTVTTASGLARITCKEIKDDSVRVIVNGQERLLSLRHTH